MLMTSVGGDPYPCGEEITGTSNDTYKFTQSYRDSDSGLDYMNARYYANGIGRFLTSDDFDASASPATPQSWNRYAYVQNDPVNYYDLSGRLLAQVSQPERAASTRT
jgi:RHS repeat-associated protein